MQFYERFSEAELKTLEARAQRIAGTNQDIQDAAINTALVVNLGNESYALPIQALKAVYEDVSIIPVPCVPAYVAGITNIRGHIIPVLDLSKLLGATTQDDLSSLVVASNQAMTVAFSVESVGEVVTYTAQEVEPMGLNAEAAQSNYVYGVLPDGTGVLDIAAILGDPNLTIAETF